MFTVNLHYPQGGWTKGAMETIESSNVPQIGQTIFGERYRGPWTVTEVCQSIRDGVLGDAVTVVLAEEG